MYLYVICILIYCLITSFILLMKLFLKSRRVNMNIKVDDKERFISVFNEKTGSYFRSGVIEDDKTFETMKNTKNVGHLFLQSIMAGGKDPFMASYPELLDIGIMQTCVCSHKCNVDCYQKAVERSGANMSLENPWMPGIST